MSKTIRKTIHYKHATFLQYTASTLQELLTAAVASKSSVDDRITEPTESTRRLLNDSRNQGGCFTANVIQYEPDAALELVTIINTVKSMPVSPETVDPDADGRKREAVKGMLHFGVFGNHVGYVGSTVLTWKALETYLNEFLRDAGVLDEDDIISLVDAPSREMKERVKKSSIRKVQFGQGLEMRNAHDDADSTPKEKEAEVKKVKMIPEGKAAEILSAAFGPDWFKSLFSSKSNSSSLAPSTDEIIDPEHLRVQLEVGYHRKSTEDDQKVLQSLAGLALTDSDEERPYEVVLENGSKIRGSDLVIKGQMTGEIVKGVIPTTTYFTEIAKWLREEYKNGLLSE